MPSASSVIGGGYTESIVGRVQIRFSQWAEITGVSAFSGAQLEEAVIKDIFDLQNSAPGLQSVQEQSNSSSNFSIRGIGTSGQNFGLESSVGMYVDGIYRARQSSMISEMINIQAVEILRGPQGTLFGKNTPSGAISFHSVAPSHEADAYVSVTGGNFGQMNASAAGNLSMIDDVLAVRGTVFRSSRDGTFSVDDFSDAELNNRNRQGGRLQALFTPSDDLPVRLIGDYSEIDETCCGISLVQDNLTVANGAAGSDAAIAALGGTVYEGDNTGNYQSSLSSLPVSKSRDRGLSMDVSWDLDESYTLNFITGYRKYNSSSASDVDFTNIDLLSNKSDAKSTTFSEEIRLDYTGEELSFVVGAYYFQLDLDLDASLNGYDDLNAFVTSGELGEFIGGTETLAGFGLISDAASSQAFLPGMVASRAAKQKHKSWAVFGQFDYDLTDRVILTAGLRYTEEEKGMLTAFDENWTPAPAYAAADLDSAIGALGAAGGGDFTPLLILLGNDPTHFDNYSTPGWGGYLFSGFTPRDDINASLNDSQITGTVKLSWLATEDAMLYASYGTGYKSGGTNTDRIAPGFSPVFGAETSAAFELGVKTEFPERVLRINAALQYTTVENFQGNAFVGSGFLLQNAGELESYGAELEVFWVPAQNTEVSLTYALTKAIYAEYKSAGCQVATPTHTGVAETRNADGVSCDRFGGKLPNSPDHAVNLGVKQLFIVADGIEGYVYG